MIVFSIFLISMTILFGISVQIILLDIRINNLESNQRIFFVVANLLVLAASMVLPILLTVTEYMKIYVLVVHVPIFLIFWITVKTSAIKVIFAIFTAVFSIYPANVVMTILSHTAWWLYPAGFYIIYIALCAVLLLLIYRFFKTNFNYLIKNYSGRSFIKLCLLPLAYYMGNYYLGMYNYDDVLSAEVIVQRSLLFIITLIAYVLILDIAKSTREKEALQEIKMALSSLLESSKQQLSVMKTTQEQARVYRHDMRHHLAMIGAYLGEGEVEKAENYVKLTQADIKVITPKRYCENSTVNLILSSFVAKASSKGVDIVVDAELHPELSISETELCALLANGLENAVEAAAQVVDEKFRKVRISLQTHKSNLLILIENSFKGKVSMEGGLPQSSREDHGFGTRSIAMIAEKYKGYCSFEAKEEIFTLRIVLPL